MKRALILAVLLSGCAPHNGEEEAKPVALVTTAPITRGVMSDTVEAFGSAVFSPAGERGLTAPVEALVASVQAGPGSLVKAGDPVVTLMPSAGTRLELDKVSNEAQSASAAYARAQRLRETGLDSDAEVETARGAAASAASTLRGLTARTGAALVLRAPIAGVVEAVAFSPGDLVAAGANAAKVGDVRDLRVRLGLEARYAAMVRSGAKVRLAPVAGGPERIGAVIDVDPRIDAQTRLASVTVRAQADAGFSPGEPLRGLIVLGERGAAIITPRAALLYDRDRPYVFVAAGGTAHRREVMLGGHDGDRVEIYRQLVEEPKLARRKRVNKPGRS